MRRIRSILFLFVLFLVAGSDDVAAQIEDQPATNPVIWADVPDPSVIRVDDTYYMTSTTMHMAPGVPIMSSKNLVDWKIASYAYDVLDDTDALALRNGQNAYGRGTWASSIRYRDGTFYVVTFSYTTGRTYVFTTDNIEEGTWERSEFSPAYHDPGLFFDDDGSVYLIYGGTDIRIVELTSDAKSVKPGGLNQLIIPSAGEVAGTDFIVAGEGAHVHKVDGYYYVFLITWPQGGSRTQIVYRAENLTGPWEGRVALSYNGIAQGGLVDTPEGDWYAFLFQDHGAVGRIPYLVEVTWEDGWPLLGRARSFGGGRTVPRTLDINTDGTGISGIVASDEFVYESDANLSLVWQWNHNPVSEWWSVTDRPGHLRLTNGRIDTDFPSTNNTLTQRTFGPRSAATIAVDATELKPGDTAGLGLLQEDYGYVGVRHTGESKAIVMVDGSSGSAVVSASVPIDQEVVYLGTEIDYTERRDQANFYYSLDGEEWLRIGGRLEMSYKLSHFMGYRFSLFTYATEETGGYADFDFFRVGNTIADFTPTDVAQIRDLESGIKPSTFPNPVRDRFTIEYHLETSGSVQVVLYDILGRQIDAADDAVMPSGRHQLRYDASSLPSGTYLYRIKTDGRTQSGMITVAR